MLKLYKKLRPVDWVLLLVLVGLTVLQVYCTMLLADYVGEFTAKLQLIAAGAIGAGELWMTGLYMQLVSLGGFACQVSVGLIASFVASNLSAVIRTDIYAKVDGFSVAEYNLFSTPSLITRTTNDVQQVQMANILLLRMAVAAPITAIWAICKVNASSMQLTWVTIAAVVALVLFLTLLLVFVMPKFRIVQKLVDKINGVSRENLTGLRVVRAYNAEKYQEEKFEKANENITKTQLFTGRLMALMSPVMSLIMNAVTLTIYWLGASLINAGNIDLPTVQTFMMLATQIIMSFMTVMMMFVILPRAQVSATRINQVLETKPTIIYPEKDAPLTEKGTVEFKNVSFSYPDSEEAVIKNISFRAEKGDTVAFIGSTGSGKSTLINLVPRFFDATEGEILIDGADIKTISKATLRKLIGYVPQKGVLFTGTVKDNIAFGNPDLTDEEIIAAAKTAEADEFISKMENGYSSEIAQGGKNVSGGQKQRISIARAIAVNPEIFIFDDSFSALDYKTDKQVRANLKTAAAGATKLIVAQRIGTISDADLIVVLDGGEAVGVGKHSELLENCPVYREIALSQLSEEELGI